MNIKELAKQARLTESNNDGIRIETGYWVEELTRFAELVAAHTLMNIDPSKFIGGYQEGFEAGSVKEREECIKAVEKILLELANQPIESVATKKMVIQSANIVIEGVIEAIKARGTR